MNSIHNRIESLLLMACVFVRESVRETFPSKMIFDYEIDARGSIFCTIGNWMKIDKTMQMVSTAEVSGALMMNLRR